MKLISQTKTVDAFLLIYGTVVTFFLTVNAITSLTFFSDLIILALFLPVTAYFFWQVAQFIHRRLHSFLNPGFFTNPPTTSYYFSLPTFLDQDNRLFLVNLLLLTIAVCLTLLRLSLIIWSRS